MLGSEPVGPHGQGQPGASVAGAGCVGGGPGPSKGLGVYSQSVGEGSDTCGCVWAQAQFCPLSFPGRVILGE